MRHLLLFIFVWATGNAAAAQVYVCTFDKRCSSLTEECGNELLKINADFDTGMLRIVNSGNLFRATILKDRVMPFRSLIVLDGGGAVSTLSMHSNNSAVYTTHTGLVGADAIWSSSSGYCEGAV